MDSIDISIEQSSSGKSAGKGPYFIAMNQENLAKYRDLIRPLGHDMMIVCDIDNTLYSNRITGLEDMMEKKLLEYIRRRIASTDEEAVAIKKMYDTKYGLSIYGILLEQKGVERDFYTENVSSAIEYKDFLKEDLVLRKILDNIKCRKICFTNGDLIQASSILEAMGLTDCFEAVITVDESTSYRIHKPEKESFEFIEELFQIKNTKNVLFFDDNIKNIKQASSRGWTAEHVQNDGHIGDIIVDAVQMLYMNAEKLINEGEDEIEVKEG